MALHTASEVISLSRKLENDSATFYEEIARMDVGDAEAFSSFAKENRKNVTQIERAYYGVITDAIEGGFAFNIEPDDYVTETSVPAGIDINDALKQAIGIEETIIRFYTEAAEQSKSLMADVPRAFVQIARKRAGRLEKLGSLLKD